VRSLRSSEWRLPKAASLWRPVRVLTVRLMPASIDMGFPRLHRVAIQPRAFLVKVIDRIRHHRPSRARTTAGLSGFLTLIQSREGPDR
jgi:hypothetical protein